MPAPLESLCEGMLARIDGWAELSAVERDLVAGHARSCARCAEALEISHEISASFRRQPRFECPPEIKAQALAHASREWAQRDRKARESANASKPASGPSSWMSWVRIAWQPALAAGLLALIALLPASLSRPTAATRTSAGTSTAAPSAAEIARAEQDLKLALAYFGRVTATAETTLRREMVDNVITPTRRAWTLDEVRRPARR